VSWFGFESKTMTLLWAHDMRIETEL